MTLRIVNNNFESSFDSQGSYTGVNAFDKYEKPIQDADDLQKKLNTCKEEP